MMSFEERQERIKGIKMFQIVRRAIALDHRSKIKPTLHNPSLLDMSEYRGSGVAGTFASTFASEFSKNTRAINDCKCERRPPGPSYMWTPAQKQQTERECNNKDAIDDYKELRAKDPAGWDNYIKVSKCS